jgi:hypothetical protein
MLKNERGLALPIVLMMTTILIVLGLSLLSLSANGMRRATFQDNKTQAYYLAKSGANAVAQYVISHYAPPLTNAELNSLNSQVNGNKALVSIGTFNVQVNKVNNTQSLKIVSTGTARGVQEKASLILDSGAFSFNDKAIHALNSISGIGVSASVYGKIATVSTALNAITVDPSQVTPSGPGSITQGVSIPLPPVQFPSITPCNNDLITEPNITSNRCYKNNVTNLSNDNISLGFSVGNQNIFADMTSLNLITGGSSLTINATKSSSAATGKLLIYFDDLNVQGTAVFKITGDPNLVVVLVKKSLTATGDAKLDFNKISIYAPEAELKFSGSSIFVGQMIGKTVTLGGNANISFFEFSAPISEIATYNLGSWGSS